MPKILGHEFPDRVWEPVGVKQSTTWDGKQDVITVYASRQATDADQKRRSELALSISGRKP